MKNFDGGGKKKEAGKYSLPLVRNSLTLYRRLSECEFIFLFCSLCQVHIFSKIR